MTAVLRTKGIGVHFAGVKALQDIDLELHQGEVLGLIGPNGAGKTTMVNVLSGYQRPTLGTVHIDDADVTRLTPAKRAKAGLVRTFQNVRLFPDLNVFDNVYLGAMAAHRSKSDAIDLTVRLIEGAGLTQHSGTDAGSLPYGATRRLGIARALAVRPRFLLLDEPAAGLNDAESAALVKTLQGLPEEFGVGVLLIEHDMHVVMSVCMRIHVLDYGKTLAVGDPQAIRSDPEVQRAYFGHSVEVPNA